MSGFDLPPIQGLDRSFLQNMQKQGPMQSSFADVFQGPELPVPGIRGGPGEIGEPGRIGGSESPFSGVLADSLGQVRDLQLDVKDKVRGMVLGEDVELHDVMIAGSKSEAAFNLLLEVRNKLVDAWEKLSRSAV